jgi:hypothetical protein
MKNYQKSALAVGLTASFCFAFFSPTTVYAQTYKGFNVGQYQGQVYNKTGNNYGKATLVIRSIAPNGSVQATLSDSDGLEGDGSLTGAINANGVLQLSGPMTSPSDGSVWQSAFIAVMQNGQIRMGNRLTLGNVVQEETATMAYAGGPAPARRGPVVPLPASLGGVVPPPCTARLFLNPQTKGRPASDALFRDVIKAMYDENDDPYKGVVTLTVNNSAVGAPYRWAPGADLQVLGLQAKLVYPVQIMYTTCATTDASWTLRRTTTPTMFSCYIDEETNDWTCAIRKSGGSSTQYIPKPGK